MSCAFKCLMNNPQMDFTMYTLNLAQHILLAPVRGVCVLLQSWKAVY